MAKAKLPPPLPLLTLKRLFTAWKKPMERGENLLIISAPLMDRVYRIPQFVEGVSNRYQVSVVALVPEQIEDVNDWHQFVARKTTDQKGSKPVFFVSDAECLFEDRRHLAYGLAEWHIASQTPLILFSERFPYKGLPSVLAQNRIFHELYEATDMRQFITYLEIKFGVSTKQAVKNEIIKRSGGHLWLIKQIMRYIASGESGDPFDHEDLWWRVEQVYQRFTPAEQKALQAVVLDRQPDDSEALFYLGKTGLVRDGRLAIGLLGDYLKKLIRKTVSPQLVQGKITIGQVPLDHFFSRQESQALRFLLSHAGTTVSREALGTALWGGEVEFSDWALDQAVKRLRQKLLKFGVPLSYIQTIKGKGYYVAG